MGTSEGQVLVRSEAEGHGCGKARMCFRVPFFQAFLGWFLKSISEQLQHRVPYRIEVSSIGKRKRTTAFSLDKKRTCFSFVKKSVEIIYVIDCSLVKPSLTDGHFLVLSKNKAIIFYCILHKNFQNSVCLLLMIPCYCKVNRNGGKGFLLMLVIV